MEIAHKTRPILKHAATVSIFFYSRFVTLAIGVWKFTSYMNPSPYVTRSVSPPGARRKAGDGYASMGNLPAPLATGLLAGLGLFLPSRPKQRLRGRKFWPATASALFTCLSVYFG